MARRLVIVGMVVATVLGCQLAAPRRAAASNEAGLARLDRLGYVVGGAALLGVGVVFVVLATKRPRDAGAQRPAAPRPASDKAPRRRASPPPARSSVLIEPREASAPSASIAVRVLF